MPNHFVDIPTHHLVLFNWTVASVNDQSGNPYGQRAEDTPLELGDGRPQASDFFLAGAPLVFLFVTADPVPAGRDT